MEKKMGRPPKSEEAKAKVKVWVYLTPDEKRQLDRYVQKVNSSVSTVLRNLLRNEGIVRTEEP